jgi:hypothetical protein
VNMFVCVSHSSASNVGTDDGDYCEGSGGEGHGGIDDYRSDMILVHKLLGSSERPSRTGSGVSKNVLQVYPLAGGEDPASLHSHHTALLGGGRRPGVVAKDSNGHGSATCSRQLRG